MTGIALAGTGMWGLRLAEAAGRAGLELVTCFSRDEARRAEFAGRFGCEAAERMRQACTEAGVTLMVGHAFRRLGASRRVKKLLDGVVTLEFESGALGSLTGSYVSPKTLSLRLLGTEAVLEYRTDFSVWPDARAVDGVTTLTLDGGPVEFEERDMLAEELAEFGRCIRGEAEPETGADEGIEALAAVFQALETHAEAVS